MQNSSNKKDNTTMLRRCRIQTGQKRVSHKVSYTDEEYKIVNEVAHRMGLASYADVPLYLAEHIDELEAFANARLEKQRMQLRPLATFINQIDANINVEMSTKNLIEGVRNILCD